MKKHASFQRSILAATCFATTLATTLGSNIAVAEIKMDYGSNLRYRYEFFDRDQDAMTPPDATSKASTARLGLFAKATLTSNFAAYVDIEAIEQVGEDDYNIPTIPGQAIPGYPIISDPQGAEVNQGYLSYTAWGGKVQAKLGRQEVMLNNGRFVSFSGWRQNHQSFNGFTASFMPATSVKIDYGYLTKLLRVSGEEATNGRTDMDSHFVNAAYTLKDVGVFKAYALLLDFETERTNSADTFGVRYEGNMPMGGIRFLSTLDYATQTEAGDNPNTIDADYLLAELGIQVADIAFRIGYNLLEGSSTTNKFITPLAHPFNGWTELFLANPSLGTSHGLEVMSLSAIGKVPGTSNLTFTTIYYDYSSDTGDASYGTGLDFQLEYKANPKTTVGWRWGQYMADELFSDAVRTSLYMAYTF
ncbi:MAG: alginate export family protein [Pseudomonadota bacterium]